MKFLIASTLKIAAACVGLFINKFSDRVKLFSAFKFSLMNKMYESQTFYTVEGIKFFGNALSEESFWRLRKLGKKEPLLCKLIRGLDSDDVFWDIGANVGQFSLYAALIGKSKIISFEIEPASFLNLISNISSNQLGSQVTPFCMGLSNKNGYSTIILPRNIMSHAGRSCIYSDMPDNYSSINVPVLTGDSCIEIFGIQPPTFIKLDVDGPELEILRGMPKILQSPSLKTIVVECVCKGENSNFDSINNFLSKFGFSIFESHNTSSNSLIHNVVFYRP